MSNTKPSIYDQAQLRRGGQRSGLIALVMAFFFLGTAVYAFDFAPFLAIEQDGLGRTEWLALGPLIEKSISGSPKDATSVVAFPRPFYSRFSVNGGERRGWDVLWPLSFGRARDRGGYQYAILFIHTNRLQSDGDSSRERWWLIPFVFYGRTATEGAYFGLFPLLGKVPNIVGYDHLKWVLFPLYLAGQKKDVKSWSILWPVFGHADGAELDKWRIFPLYGKRATPREKRRFFLWPFIHTAAHYQADRGRIGSGFFILPLVGHYKGKPQPDEADYRIWTFLWPFFSGRRQGDNFRHHLPWPFYQHARTVHKGAESVKRYFWPFYGHDLKPRRSYRFYAWPLVQKWQSETGKVRNERFWFLPFYWSSKSATAAEVEMQTRHFWPLAAYTRKGEDARFWALAPWYKASGDPITRNYAPLWRLFTYAREGENRQHQLLWGLWQYDSGPAGRDISLFPLFDYERQGGDSHWTFLKGLLGRRTNSETGVSRTRVLWLLKW